MTSILIYVVTFLSLTHVSAAVNVSGIGASFPGVVYQRWAAAYSELHADRNVLVNYHIENSISGECHIAHNCTSHLGPFVFAGTDRHFTNTEHLKAFPVLAGAIAIVYNLPGIDLNLDQSLIADIFDGTITTWNHSRLQALNPDVALPSDSIIPIARRDRSGTTNVFTRALSEFKESWKENFGSFSDPLIDQLDQSWAWPYSVKYFGHRNLGIVGLVTSIRHSISYLSYSDALSYSVQIASLYNSFGDRISQENVLQSVAEATKAITLKQNENLVYDIVAVPIKFAYPIASFTYHIVNISTSPDVSCASAIEYIKFMLWVFQDVAQEQNAKKEFMVPLAANAVTIVQDKLLKMISCKGKNVFESIHEEKEDKIGEQYKNKRNTVLGAMGVILLVLIMGVMLYIIKKRKFQEYLDSKQWLLDQSLVVPDGSSSTTNANELFAFENRFGRYTYDGETAIGYEVSRKYLNLPFNNQSKMLLLNVAKRWKHHENVLRFLGIYNFQREMNTNLSEGHNSIFMFQGSIKGTLHAVMKSTTFPLSNDAYILLALDVATGMEHLHKLGIIHGALNSVNCVVDHRWTVKVSKWPINQIFNTQCCKSCRIGNTQFWREEQGTVSSHGNVVDALDIVCVDPNIRNSNVEVLKQHHDAYSFGVMVTEMFDFGNFRKSLLDTELADVGRFRPKLEASLKQYQGKNDKVSACVRMVNKCLHVNHNMRPEFSELKKMLREASNADESIADVLLRQMESYIANLEGKWGMYTNAKNKQL